MDCVCWPIAQVYTGTGGGDLDGKELFKWVTSSVPAMFTVEVTAGTAQQFITAAAPPRSGDDSEEDADEDEVLPPEVAAVKNIPPKVRRCVEEHHTTGFISMVCWSNGYVDGTVIQSVFTRRLTDQ